MSAANTTNTTTERGALVRLGDNTEQVVADLIERRCTDYALRLAEQIVTALRVDEGVTS